ncbi:MAG: hypothetical protein J7K23_03335 [Thermoproteales archaeon]|nr:hypothetical protein [Thermoproteales archaeon]
MTLKRTSMFIKSSHLLHNFFSTGCGSLDKLIGKIKHGSVYLFYGDETVLEKLLYNLSVRGFIEYGRVLVLTLRDYHNDKIFNTYDLGYTAIQYWLNPEDILKNVYIAPIFNRRQSANIEEIIRFISSYNIKLILVWATTDLFRYEDYPMLIDFLGQVKEAIQNDATIIFFSRSSKLSKRYPPSPDGPKFFRHFPSILVYFERKNTRLVKMILAKHPSKPISQAYAFLDYHGLVDLYG